MSDAKADDASKTFEELGEAIDLVSFLATRYWAQQNSTIDSLNREIDHLLESNAEYQGENAALRRLRKELRGEIRELRGEVWRYQELRAACEAMTYADAVAGAEAWGRMQTALRDLAQSSDTPDIDHLQKIAHAAAGVSCSWTLDSDDSGRCWVPFHYIEKLQDLTDFAPGAQQDTPD